MILDDTEKLYAMDESKGKNDEGNQDEPQELTPGKSIMQLLQWTYE